MLHSHPHSYIPGPLYPINNVSTPVQTLQVVLEEIREAGLRKIHKMGRGECGGSKVTDEDEVDHDPSHTGPIKNRSCTDVLCLLLLLVFAVGWGVISVYAFLHGNPVQLIYPSNSKGT